MSILIGRKSNSQLNLPQLAPALSTGALAVSDVTTTSWWLVMIGVGVQIDARPMPVSLDTGTKPCEVTADPLVCVCAEQECHRRRAAVFAGTGWAGGQPDALWHGVRIRAGYGRVVGGLAHRPLLFGVCKHTQGVQGKVAVWARNRGRHTTQHWIDVGRQC